MDMQECGCVCVCAYVGDNFIKENIFVAINIIIISYENLSMVFSKC